MSDPDVVERLRMSGCGPWALISKDLRDETLREIFRLRRQVYLLSQIRPGIAWNRDDLRALVDEALTSPDPACSRSA